MCLLHFRPRKLLPDLERSSFREIGRFHIEQPDTAILRHARLQKLTCTVLVVPRDDSHSTSRVG